MPEHSVSIAGSFGDAIEIEIVTIFQRNHLVCIRISRSQRSNIVGMVRIPAEGMLPIGMDPVARVVGAGQRHLEYVPQIQIGLPQDKMTVAQVGLKTIHRTGRGGRHGATSKHRRNAGIGYGY